MSEIEKAIKVLSAEGRGGDSILVHMRPDELAALEKLYGSTTINPETGLPEAFSWKKFLLGAALASAAFIPGVNAGLVSMLGKMGLSMGAAGSGATAAAVGTSTAAKTAAGLLGIGKAAGLGLLGSAAMDKGSGNSTGDTSEAGKYLDARMEDKAKEMHKFPVQAYGALGSTQAPNLLGVQQQHFGYPTVRKMGRGFEDNEDAAMFAGGGITSLGGRMIHGQGGGLDDAIPALLGGRQPAALSDGEYVIPADVVSMMGDGSSNAGGKKLDQLVAKVRVQKTGRKKQAKKLRGI